MSNESLHGIGGKLPRLPMISGVIMKTDYQNIFERLRKIYRKYLKKHKNPDSNQICCMWSTKNPPDEIYECSQIHDIDKEFNICLSEDDTLAIYDMDIDEATEYTLTLQKIWIKNG